MTLVDLTRTLNVRAALRRNPEAARIVSSPSARLLARNHWLDLHVDDIEQAAREVAAEMCDDEPADPSSHEWVEANAEHIIQRAVRNAERGAVKFERECEEGETL